MAFGDYVSYKKESQPSDADVDVLAADASTKTAVVAVANADWTIYVQKITFSVTTDAAQSLTFQDSAGTPVPIAKNKVSPGLGPIVWDFGPKGTALTKGKNLDIAISGAGLAGRVHIEAYQKQGTSAVQITGSR